MVCFFFCLLCSETLAWVRLIKRSKWNWRGCRQSLLYWRLMDNHNVGGGRHSARTLQNQSDVSDGSQCWFFSSLAFFRHLVLPWWGLESPGKGVSNFVKSFKDNISGRRLAKRRWVWILMTIFSCFPLLHAHTITNKVSPKCSSTLLAHMWSSSDTTRWKRASHWGSVLDDPTMPCCRSRFLRIWFLDFQSSTWATATNIIDHNSS